MAIVNRVLTLLLGLALAAAGAWLVAETVVAAIGQPPLLIDRSLADSTASELSWTDAPVDIAIAALIGLGALLLILQLIPRQPDSLPLRAGQGREAEVERKPLAGLLAARAGNDREALTAKAKVTKRAATVAVKAQPGADVRALRERLNQMMARTLDPLELASPLRRKVSVSRSRERSS